MRGGSQVRVESLMEGGSQVRGCQVRGGSQVRVESLMRGVVR